MSPAAFRAVEEQLLAQHGALHLVDLDGDVPIPSHRFRTSKLQLDLALMPALGRYALLFQEGSAGEWRWITPRWLADGALQVAFGYHPAQAATWGSTAQVEPNGTILVQGVPARMAGYDWSRRFRLTHDSTVGPAYSVAMVEERLTPGPYPTTPQDLVTAAFIAHWWDLADDLARYIPDEAVRAAFLATPVAKVRYWPQEAAVGTLRFEPIPDSTASVPMITAAPLDQEGATDFLATVVRSEGHSYYAGRVTFAQAADGRLIISQIAVTSTGYSGH